MTANMETNQIKIENSTMEAPPIVNNIEAITAFESKIQFLRTKLEEKKEANARLGLEIDMIKQVTLPRGRNGVWVDFFSPGGKENGMEKLRSGAGGLGCDCFIPLSSITSNDPEWIKKNVLRVMVPKRFGISAGYFWKTKPSKIVLL